MLHQALIIDKDLDAARATAQCLKSRWPQVGVRGYDPAANGLPDDRFDWSRFQLVFLDYELGIPGQTGLDWLSELRGRPGFPPAIFITSSGNERVAVRALKLGAADYINREGLSPDALAEAVHDAIPESALSDTGVHEADPDSVPELPRASNEGEGAIDADRTQLLVRPAPGPTAPAPQVMADDRTQLLARPDANPGTGNGASASSAENDRTQMLERPGPDASSHGEEPPLIERRSFDRQPDIAPIKVEGYRVIKPVGAGGMANVFLTERRRDGKILVLKIMRVDEDEDPRLLRRFLREYQLLSNIEHPNIVRIYDRIMADDYACLAMEYCNGGDLVQYIGKGLEAATALDYLRQMASGLSVAHARDVVHRDLKPGNILFRSDGTLAVADFGVSARLGESRITHQSEMVGTPYYLSPEQIQGGEVDHRGDLYALGIILFEMLTGRRPYVSRHLSKLIEMHLNAPTPDLPEEHAHLRPLLDGLLAKSVDDRFQSAEEVLAALEMFA